MDGVIHDTFESRPDRCVYGYWTLQEQEKQTVITEQNETYNGWTNYETWCVALWLDNDESSQHQMYELVEEETNDYRAGDSIKEWVEEMRPDYDRANMWTDLLGHALARVDWPEIAKHYREE